MPALARSWMRGCDPMWKLEPVAALALVNYPSHSHPAHNHPVQNQPAHNHPSHIAIIEGDAHPKGLPLIYP
jgi:hypothetical protein